MELAASAGLHLDGWQAHDLDVGLGEREDGKWAARQFGVIAPRQNGKDGELEAIQLGALYLWGFCRFIIHSAHEFATASEAFLRLMWLIDNTDDLRRRVKKVHRAHGAEGIELLDGTRLKFKTRTGGSGRGFSGDLVILNEAYNLAEKAISALGPTMSARENPLLCVYSSAPLITDESAALRRFCKRGRAGAEGLAYVEYCAPDDADLDDPGMHQLANPAYPHRIGPEAIQAERVLMTDDDFARERLGIWHDPADETNQVIPSEKWAATEAETELVGEPVFGLAVAEDRSWSAFGVAGQSSLGEFMHVEAIDYRPGTAWCIPRAAQLIAENGGQIVLFSGSPAAALIKDLQSVGLQLSSPADPDSDDIVVLPLTENARACGQLYDRTIAQTLRHRNQPALLTAIKAAVQRPAGDEAWVWSRRRSSIDISPLEAITAAVGHYGAPAKKKRKPTYAY